MVQFFETQQAPSWMDLLAQGLGQGIAKGSENRLANLLEEKRKAPLTNYLKSMTEERARAAHQGMMGEQDRATTSQFPQSPVLSDLSQSLSPQEQYDQLFINMPPELASLDENVQKQRDAALKRDTERQKIKSDERVAKEKEYFNFNEPELLKIGNQRRSLSQNKLRYQKMAELNEFSDKFPSRISVGLLTDKEGNLNNLAKSGLSTEAQEFVKLTYDMLQGVKDTFGANKVTNFDVQSYLNKLPTLINSKEGREKIIQDLQNIDAINDLYYSGIEEIFDKYGGSDKISMSNANRIFNKVYGSELADLEQQYLHPLPTKGIKEGDIATNKETGEQRIFTNGKWRSLKK